MDLPRTPVEALKAVATEHHERIQHNNDPCALSASRASFCATLRTLCLVPIRSDHDTLSFMAANLAEELLEFPEDPAELEAFQAHLVEQKTLQAA